MTAQLLNMISEEIEFDIFWHDRKLTVLPEVGVIPIPITLYLAKSTKPSAVWHINDLNIDALTLKVDRKLFTSKGISMADVVLAAMIATHGKGINPLDVRGWTNHMPTSRDVAVRETYEKWVQAQM